MEEIMLKSALAAASLGALLATAPAVAGEQDGRSIHVTYGDLTLAAAAGQDRLEGRIVRAARKVCGVGSPTTRPRQIGTAQRNCMAAAMKSAHSQMADAIDEQKLGA